MTQAPSQPPRDQTGRNATVVIAVILAGAAIYALRSILTPFALAVFLAVMIDGLARVLATRVPGFPKRAAVPVALILSGLILALVTFVIANNAGQFVAEMGTYRPRLQDKLGQLAALVGAPPPLDLRELFGRLNLVRYLGVVVEKLRGIVSDSMLVAVFLGFIIASRRGFRRKAVAMFPQHDQRVHAADLFQRMRDGIERYLWVQTVSGLLIAGLTFVAMAGVRLDNAIFWAFLIFIACYVPIIGGAVAIVLPAIFALVQFDSLWQAALLLCWGGSLHFVIGNIILPRMQGDSLNIDPLVVLLGLAFWGMMMGVAGMFLSTPLTVMVMVILAQFQGSLPLAVLLSADGDPQGLSRRGRHGPAGN
ncbi:MAG: hypothetical protein JWM33_3712 [Caulobacteraceae bacterium]|nr:hypothetical protein [Caulobacteraceae bacterium]